MRREADEVKEELAKATLDAQDFESKVVETCR